MLAGSPASAWRSLPLQPLGRGVRRAYRMLVDRWGASRDGLRVARVPGLAWVAEGLALVGVGEGLVLARPRPDRRVQLYHASFDQSVTFSAGRLEPDDLAPWTNPLRQLLFAWLQAGVELTGVDGVILGAGPGHGPTGAPVVAACVLVCCRPPWVRGAPAAWLGAGPWPGRWAEVAAVLQLLAGAGAPGPDAPGLGEEVLWKLAVLPGGEQADPARGSLVPDSARLLEVWWPQEEFPPEERAARPAWPGRAGEGMAPGLRAGSADAVAASLREITAAGLTPWGGPAGGTQGEAGGFEAPSCALWVAAPDPEDPLKLAPTPWGLLRLAPSGVAGTPDAGPAGTGFPGLRGVRGSPSPAQAVTCEIRRGGRGTGPGRERGLAGRS